MSIPHALEAEVRLYDRLFSVADPEGDKEVDFIEHINPNSLEIITGYVEPSLKDLEVEDKVQFQRIGYYNVDTDSTPEHPVFNRTVGLRESK